MISDYYMNMSDEQARYELAKMGITLPNSPARGLTNPLPAESMTRHDSRAGCSDKRA